MKKRGILFLKLALAGGLVYYLVASETLSLEAFATALRSLKERWHWFATAQLVFGAVLFLSAFRWKLILSTQGIEYSIGSILKLTLIGFFFNQCLPGSTGGDVVKAYYVASHHPKQKVSGILTVLFDRALGLAVLVWIAALGMLPNLELVHSEPILASLVWAVVASAVLVAGGALFFYGAGPRFVARLESFLGRLPFQDAIRKLTKISRLYRGHPRRVLTATLVSAAMHGLIIITNVCLVLSLSESTPSLESFLLLVPLAQVVMAVPLTPGALGTGEIAYQKLFELVGITTGAIICILLRLTYFFWGLWGCVLYLGMWRGRFRSLKPENEDRATDPLGTEPQAVSGPRGEAGRETSCPSPKTAPRGHHP